MEKVYLFGASINCSSVINFLGQENIVALIDNDTKKHGTMRLGLEVISLDEYLRRNDKRKIFIASFYRAEEIICGLKKRGIGNYQKSPWMQSGYFASGDEVVDKLTLVKYPKVAFYDRNPIAEKIADTLIERSPFVEITYIEKGNLIDLQKEVPILLTINESEEEKELLKSKYGEEAVYDVEKIYMEMYRFKNPKLRQFKDIHRGKRCFIVGNGPSLRMEDLELLHERKEICFAGNAIYRAYENTHWRPHYYVVVDSSFLELCHEEIDHLKSICFINHINGKEYHWTGDNVYEFGRLPNIAEKVLFSYDIEEGIYSGWTLVYEAIQIALYMGFTEIYLLGVDASSGGEHDTDHFYGKNEEKVRERVIATLNRMPMRKSIGAAGEAVVKSGAILKNATRGGELEEIERVKFDSLF